MTSLTTQLKCLLCKTTTNAIPFEIRNDVNGQEWIYFEFLSSAVQSELCHVSVSEVTGFKEKLFSQTITTTAGLTKNSEFNT
jgi:hypothetical protein